MSGTSSDRAEPERVLDERHRRNRSSDEDLRKAMKKAWATAAKSTEADPTRRRAAAWAFLCGWLRSAEDQAGLPPQPDPEGEVLPRRPSTRATRTTRAKPVAPTP